MSKIEVDAITEQSGSTLTTGGGAGKTVVVDATTVTLGRCGGTVALASGASQTGFGRTGTVDWQTGSIKTATFTAANGEGYFANTSSGGFTMNLPAGSAGAIVSVVDYTNTFQTNNLTVAPNGSEKIGGIASSIALSTEGQSVTFVYVDGTEGWKNVQDSTSNVTGNPFMCASVSGSCNTLVTCGNFKIATFKGPGNFTVNSTAACAANNIVDYVVVGGGGAGGYQGFGGGGGGGGFRFFATTPVNPQSGPGAPRNGYGSPSPSGTAITVTATAFPIAVGAGGAGVPCGVGNSGAVSTFSTVTSAGGGGGGGGSSCAASGGSGGGARSLQVGGAGNTPPVTPPQGSPGFKSTSPSKGGGGGGAMAGSTCGTCKAGGAGAGITGFGSTGQPSGGQFYFSGGGGSFVNPGVGGTGGLGGGGGGSGAPDAPDKGAGDANTGGAGGASAGSDGSGGSGIVIIRYKFP